MSIHPTTLKHWGFLDIKFVSEEQLLILYEIIEKLDKQKWVAFVKENEEKLMEQQLKKSIEKSKELKSILKGK